jgi:hypothetical protein
MSFMNIRYIILIMLILVAIVNQFTQEVFNIVLLSSYLDDVLIVPIAMGISIVIQRYFILKSQSFSYSIWSVVCVCIFFSIAFELVIPKFSIHYHADKFDLIAYALGGIIFYMVINPSSSTSPNN